MSRDSSTLIGRIIDVQGNTLVAELRHGSEEGPLVVTVGDEDIQVGRLGSFVLIVQGPSQLLAVVNRMTEHEKIDPGDATTKRDHIPTIPYAERVLRLTAVGTMSPDGTFRRGVILYPTTGAEVHAVGSSELH